MELTIKFMEGTTFTLSVNPGVTVGELKRVIAHKANALHSNQRLVVQNGSRRDLDDDTKTLSAYGLRSGDVVAVLVIAEQRPFQIFLRNDRGQTHTYDVTPDMTVKKFKSKVHEVERVPVDQQRLIFGGIQMEDGKTLEYYKIKPESTIFLDLRLRGG
nr:PREDICTED: polyubiquitin-like [Lepisosteus oculatus]XP_015221474.1 PREDICTED: polyubiquitin-like [Lepisosteus oculatus]